MLRNNRWAGGIYKTSLWKTKKTTKGLKGERVCKRHSERRAWWRN